MNAEVNLSTPVLETLKPRLRAVYQCWVDGLDLREMYPKKTFYRYRNELLEHGIDIAVKQPRDDSLDNVVPLRQVIVARPWQPPEWVYDSEYYFDPSKHQRRVAVGA